MNIKGIGKKMAEINIRYRNCIEPMLTDQECSDLRDWFKEIYEYNKAMGHDINVIFFGMNYEDLERVCSFRNLSK